MRSIRTAVAGGIALLGALSLITACLLFPSDTHHERHISYLDSVSVPDSAYVAVPFEVVINTIGANTCWSQGPDEVTPIAGGFSIVPHAVLAPGRDDSTAVVVEEVTVLEGPPR